MKYLVLLAVLLTASCATTDEAAQDAPLSYNQCTSDAVQKVLTFCASPKVAAQSAELFKTHEMRVQGASGDSLGPVPVGDSPTLGPDDAPVTIVMFTDLQCPFCAKAHQEIKAVIDNRPQDVRLVFKHTPLPFHQDAVPAAVGAIAAGEQGKFWEFAELAYAHQDALAIPQLPVYAEELGLDVEKFKKAFETEKSLDPVRTDMELAHSLGVRGTPTFFINGKRAVGALTQDELNAAIEEQLQFRQKLVDSGVESADLYWRLATLNFEALPQEPAAEPEPEPEGPAVVFVPTAGAPSIGAKPDEALVTIVEFSDFECPYCRQGAEIMKALVKKYPKEVRVVYRHYPLDFHPGALPAAVISTLAEEKGVFWAFHDAVFATETELTGDVLLKIAEGVGISKAEVEKRLKDQAAAEYVQKDMALAKEVGVEGTPSFYVNGIRIGGALPVEVFSGLIDEQIQIAKQVRDDKKVKGEALYKAMVETNSNL